MILATSRYSVWARTLKTTWMMMTMKWLAPVQGAIGAATGDTFVGRSDRLHR